MMDSGNSVWAALNGLLWFQLTGLVLAGCLMSSLATAGLLAEPCCSPGCRDVRARPAPLGHSAAFGPLLLTLHFGVERGSWGKRGLGKTVCEHV